jgi:flagellar hook-associated protein 3 FlgL
MNLTSLGDLAHSFVQRQHGIQLQQQMNRLTQELSTGEAANLTRHLGGRFDFLADIEHDLQIFDSYRLSANEAQNSAFVMQTALDQIQAVSQDLSNTALVVGAAADSASLVAVAAEGLGALDSAVAFLNTNVAGRAMFSGTDIGNIPLIPTEDILTAVRATLVGAASVANVTTALDTFFDTAGGGFETIVYQGGLTNLAPYQLGEGESVSLDLRADDPALREVLKNTVLAAVLNDASLTITDGDRHELAGLAGAGLLSGQNQLTGIRANLGFAESRIDQSLARIEAGVASLSIARRDLVSVDPFETATELENVQFQLEAIYTLTARTSRLTLLNFLS